MTNATWNTIEFNVRLYTDCGRVTYYIAVSWVPAAMEADAVIIETLGM